VEALCFVSLSLLRFFRRYCRNSPIAARKRAAARITPTAMPAFALVVRLDGVVELFVEGVIVDVDVCKGVTELDVIGTVEGVEVVAVAEVLVVSKSEDWKKRTMGHFHAWPGPNLRSLCVVPKSSTEKTTVDWKELVHIPNDVSHPKPLRDKNISTHPANQVNRRNLIYLRQQTFSVFERLKGTVSAVVTVVYPLGQTSPGL